MHATTTASEPDRKTRPIAGSIRRVMFRGQDGYCVLRLDDGACVTGHLMDARVGAVIEGEGAPVVHPRFGEQIKAHWLAEHVPEDPKDLLAFLSRGALPGIGPRLARQLLDAFGADLPNVLEHQPMRLREIRGIGAKKAKTIALSWSKLRSVRRVTAFLNRIGFGSNLAFRVHSTFGENAVALLRANPYRLTRVRGVGFERADQAAMHLGIAPDAPQRLAAALRHTTEEQARQGHTTTPRTTLLAEASTLTGQPAEALASVLDDLLDRSPPPLVETKTGVSSARLYHAERTVASHIARMLGTPGILGRVDAGALLRQNGLQPDPSQARAVELALTSGLCVLTGGPGTGKTTIVRTVSAAAANAGHTVRLCAPTGRAARRLAEASGQNAETIHRLLGARGASHFERDPENPVECDLLITDESSMIDVSLLANLLAALPAHARVVFVGDADQLPSVGPGACLRDFIAGGVPTAHLSRIYRQEEGSGIAHGAQRLLAGQRPEFGNGLWFVSEDDPEQAATRLVGLVQRAAAHHGSRAVQVLSPMRKGPLGTGNLNALLRKALNPPAPGAHELGGFRVGDRVIQTSNDYALGTMNGEIGAVRAINPEDRTLQVDYDDRSVDYDTFQLQNLEPAFAITIHKSQGSQYPCVVIPLCTQHYIMLNRPLLYTGFTRAEKDLILVGQEKALRLAVRKHHVNDRRTMLANYLKV
ncbi:ATP-dependent RecD-like DNA helicase [bacterium BMS3Bbin13]|nr:ATP-dependent RecD-like DNA helicase [bacterium BMS3Bbin13]